MCETLYILGTDLLPLFLRKRVSPYKDNKGNIAYEVDIGHKYCTAYIGDAISVSVNGKVKLVRKVG